MINISKYYFGIHLLFDIFCYCVSKGAWSLYCVKIDFEAFFKNEVEWLREKFLHFNHATHLIIALKFIKGHSWCSMATQEKSKLKCKLCDKYFKSVTVLKIHVRYEHAEIWYGFIRSATWKRIYSLTTSVLDLCALWLQNLRRLLVLGLFWLSISHFWLNWMIFVYKWHLKPFLAPLSNFGVKGYTFSLEKSETKTGCLHGKNHKFKYFAGKSHSRSLLDYFREAVLE